MILYFQWDNGPELWWISFAISLKMREPKMMLQEKQNTCSVLDVCTKMFKKVFHI